MNRHLAPVAALLISVSILLTGQGLQGTLLPVRATLEDFSTLAIGAMGAAYFLGFTIGCLNGGELIRKVGHVRVFLAMTALASAVPLLHGLVVVEWIWWILRLATGFCFAVIYIVIESWLNEKSTNENRGFVFSVYSMITLTVLAAGQMLTLLYSPSGLQLFAIASVLVSVAAIPIALSEARSPGIPQAARIDLRRLLRVSPTGSCGCLATGLVNGSFWALAPVYTQGVSNDVQLAAWFMTSAVIGGALAQWPLGVASDRRGRRLVLLAIVVTGGIASAALVVGSGGGSPLAIGLLGAFWGAMAFPLYAISVAIANDHARQDEYVNVSSGLLLLYGIGATVGPFVASGLMVLTDFSGLFLFSGIIYGLLAVTAIARSFSRRGKIVEEPVAFRASLAAARTASQVYEDEVLQPNHSDQDCH
jgi:MFS family permease